MVKSIIFDLGGVIITIDQRQAVSRFKEIGVANADELLDPYVQAGIFGDLEIGRITVEDFRRKLSGIAGREVTLEECNYAWQGYAVDVPQRNFDALQQLRREGYRVVLLSNTNPFMMEWVTSDRFDGHGNGIGHYFDALYLSYQCRKMKPDAAFYRKVLMDEHALPEETLFVDDSPRNVAAASQLGIKTFCPENGADWTKEIYNYL